MTSKRSDKERAEALFHDKKRILTLNTDMNALRYAFSGARIFFKEVGVRLCACVWGLPRAGGKGGVRACPVACVVGMDVRVGDCWRRATGALPCVLLPHA